MTSLIVFEHLRWWRPLLTAAPRLLPLPCLVCMAQVLVLEERAEEAFKVKTEQARELAAVRQQLQDREVELKMVCGSRLPRGLGKRAGERVAVAASAAHMTLVAGGSCWPPVPHVCRVTADCGGMTS